MREWREVGRALVAGVIAAALIANVGLAVGLIVGLTLYVGSFVVPVRRRATPWWRRLTLPHPIRRRRALRQAGVEAIRLADAAIRLGDELEAMADKITTDRDFYNEQLLADALSLFDRAHALGAVVLSDRAKIEYPLALDLLPGMFRSIAARVRQRIPENERNRSSEA
jgi:hypothetical protein